MIVPGERLDARAAPMIDRLLMFEAAENRFPGLGTEIQGVRREREPTGRIRFHTYVVQE